MQFLSVSHAIYFSCFFFIFLFFYFFIFIFFLSLDVVVSILVGKTYERVDINALNYRRISDEINYVIQVRTVKLVLPF